MNISRRHFLGTASVAVSGALVWADSTRAEAAPADGAQVAGAPLQLVTGGMPTAVVVVAPDADAQTHYAAQQLVSHVEQATGATLSVVQAAPKDANAIFVGTRPPGSGIPDAVIDQLDPDGFVLRRGNTWVAILGHDSWGTRFGVFDFLERYLDIRWLMPDGLAQGGPGAAVASRTDVTLHRVVVDEQPAFAGRVAHPFPIPSRPGEQWNFQLSGGSQMETWGQYARVHHTIEFQHGLWEWVPQAIYGDPAKAETYHPEFYPVHDGTTQIPAPNVRTGWQPRLTAPGVAEAAAAQILSYQQAHPDTTSYSLSMNDSGGFSDDDLDENVHNHFWMPSASAHYYAFVNRVVEIVTAQHPHLRFGVLAYREVADPPDFAIHPNVVPYLCHDTFNWVREDRRTADHAWAQRWAVAAHELGWWDYCYGNPYQVPRMYTDLLSETYRYLFSAGVRYGMAEQRPAWGEGPKLYVLPRLFWDPNHDVRLLTKDWCVHAVGQRAAPHVLAYYELWERFWTERVRDSEWLLASLRIYNTFRTAEYLELVTENDIETARGYLAKAAARTDTSGQAGRLAVVQTYFDYYAANALSYPKRTPVPPDANTAGTLLTESLRVLDRNIKLASQRTQLAATFDPNPTLATWSLIWSGWNLYAVWSLAEYLTANEAREGTIRNRLTSLAKGPQPTTARRFAELVLDIADGKVERVGENLSFESADLAPWVAPAGSGVQTTAGVSRSGKRSMKLPAGFSGAISQDVVVHPGFFRAECYIHIPSATEPITGFYAKLDTFLFDASGKRIQRLERQFALQPAIGTWYRLAQTEFLDDGVVRATCRIVVESAEPDVYVDDVSIVQLPQPPLQWSDVVDDDFTGDIVETVPAGWHSTIAGTIAVVPFEGRGNALAISGVQKGTPAFQVRRTFDAVTGDHVRLSVRILRSQARTGLILGLYDAGAQPLARFLLSNISGDIEYRGANRWVDTGIDYQLQDWHLLEAVIDRGTQTCQYLVDGLAVGTTSVETTKAGDPAQFRVAVNGGLAAGEPIGAVDDLSIAVGKI